MRFAECHHDLVPHSALFCIFLSPPECAKARHGAQGIAHSIARRCNAALVRLGDSFLARREAGQLRCYASLKENGLFRRSRASHLIASRLAENPK